MKFSARRPNPVFSPAYRVLVGLVKEQRSRAGLSQRALAERLGKSPSHVAMIEQGQRRIDTLELFLIAQALGLDTVEFFKAVAIDLNAVTGGRRQTALSAEMHRSVRGPA